MEDNYQSYCPQCQSYYSQPKGITDIHRHCRWCGELLRPNDMSICINCIQLDTMYETQQQSKFTIKQRSSTRYDKVEGDVWQKHLKNIPT